MYKFFLSAITTLALAVVFALGLSQLGLVPVAASAKEPALLAWLLHSTYKNSVKRGAAEIEVPADLNSEQKVLKGAKNFASMCAGCHTAPGKSRTATSLGLNPSPPEAALLASKLNPAERYWVIDNRIKMTGMPAFGAAHADKDELWALVAFTEEIYKLDEASYDALLAKAVMQMPGSDGHNHSHTGDQKPKQPHTSHPH